MRNQIITIYGEAKRRICFLSLRRKPLLQYDVVRRLRGNGLHDVGDSSVYGTLRRLFRAGLLNSYVQPSEEGPHRKYYGITKAGAVMLRTSAKDWERIANTVDTLLAEAGVQGGGRL